MFSIIDLEKLARSDQDRLHEAVGLERVDLSDWVDWWTVFLGFGFVLVTLYAPNGIGGLVDRLVRKGDEK